MTDSDSGPEPPSAGGAPDGSEGGTGLVATVALALGSLDLDVAVDVPAGRTLAVVGQNGAGKSTLLRALAGLQPIGAGRIALDGAVLDDPATGAWVPPHRRPVGVVFQDHRLFPNRTVLDNVAFGLRSRGAGRATARSVAAAWLERVGLGDRAGDHPDALSGGQSQRVALARALAPAPRLLLLDEPLAALDASVRAEVRRELRRHVAEHPGVRVLVTHDPVDAAALADDVAVLDAGRIVQTGTLADLTARPRTRYVADLLGVNLLWGHRSATGDGVDLDGGGRLVVVDDGASARVGRVLVAVRPAAVTLHRSRPDGSARNVWSATVAAVDVEPGRVRLTLVGPPSLVAEATPAAAAELGLTPGATVWAAVKATDITSSPA